MIKKTITYTDYDGNEVTEDYYFNISKAELIEIEASEGDGYGEKFKKMVDEKDIPLMMKTFKSLILNSIGIKAEDGKHFRKPEGYAEDFACSEAYSVLFSELCTDATAATAFIAGILPLDAQQRKEFLEQAKEAQSKVSELPENT